MPIVSGFELIDSVCLLRAFAVCQSGKTVVLDHPFDTANRLARAVLVLDKAEPHKIFTVLAKAHTGRHGYLGIRQQFFAELERPHLTIALWYLRPYKHRSFW